MKSLQIFWMINGCEGLPLGAFRNAYMSLPVGELGLVHQAAVIVLVPGNRRAPPLDRVGEEAGRPVVGDRRECFRHRLDTVAAEVFHQCCQLGIAAAVDQGTDIALVTEIIHQAFAPNRTAHEGKGGILLVRTGIDPASEFAAARFLETPRAARLRT
jgi:hypothetical protein